MILLLMLAFALPSFGEIYDNTAVSIDHDQVSYTISGYNLYIQCPQSAPESRVLLASDVIDGAVISVDLPPVAALEFCVTALASSSGGPVETGPFAFYAVALTDIVAPANGTLSIDIVCKNPACTKVTIQN